MDPGCWIVPSGRQLFMGRLFRRGLDSPTKCHVVLSVGPGIVGLRPICYLAGMTRRHKRGNDLECEAGVSKWGRRLRDAR